MAPQAQSSATSPRRSSSYTKLRQQSDENTSVARTCMRTKVDVPNPVGPTIATSESTGKRDLHDRVNPDAGRPHAVRGLRVVPIISTFFGIVIRMYYQEHEPAHFHAEYQAASHVPAER
jgi:hypothetical protein